MVKLGQLNPSLEVAKPTKPTIDKWGFTNPTKNLLNNKRNNQLGEEEAHTVEENLCQLFI